MSAPAVSVVMPVRDGEMYLDEAVRSILRQSLQDFEFLIIDDGSRDATASMIARYAAGEDRIRVITTPPLGVVPALNRGLAEAKGRYVARMDADDVAASERFARQCAALDCDPALALIGCGWRVIDRTGSVLRLVQPPTEVVALRAALAQRNCLAHASVMMRRDAARACGGYREAFRLAEDYDLWMRLSERHGIAVLPDHLLDYRQHAAQSSLSDLEQRIMSELGVHAAAARRRENSPDDLDGPAPIDRAALVALGLTPGEIRDGMLARALGAAEDAVVAGHREAAQTAIRVARRQEALAPRTRLHLAWLTFRTGPRSHQDTKIDLFGTVR
ncbi:glycosyltransferase family 2 protein [uncultured Enterovirga sp.]|uniref:glycosyltransferase family 2 protein n=1 Tax=uncultured Enterovirga sp. TaxID=2026352 RepID=UPI0035CA7E17